MAKKIPTLDPRIRRTRKLIQQAFLELLEQKPFDAITVQDVADRATVNRATFYSHYVDKFALLENFIGELFEEKLAAHMAGNPPCKLGALILVTCEFLKKLETCPSVGDRQFAPLVESRVKGHIRQLLLAELKSGANFKPNKREDIELAATVSSWAIFGAALEWSRSKNAASAENFTKQVMPLILASLKISGGPCAKNPSRKVARKR